MNELLDYLRAQSVTLTVYNHDGSEADLETLAAALSGSGIAVTTATDAERAVNYAVLTHGDEVIGEFQLSEYLDSLDFESLLGDSGQQTLSLPDLPSEGLAVSPETSRTRMVGVSRTFERRALREGSGRLLAGFQTLSTLDESERTRTVYDRLAETGVDVTVCGYPDIDLSNPPFEVFEDTDETFRDYWFLLYDGDGNDARKCALVAKEAEPAMYDSFWTGDPETVDELFALVAETYPDLV